MNSENLLKTCSHIEKIAIFCKNCNIFICDSCNSTHRKHIVINYSTKVKELQDFIEKSQENIEIFDRITSLEMKFIKKIDKIFFEILNEIKQKHENYKKNLIKSLFFNEIKEKQNDFYKKINNFNDILKKINKNFENAKNSDENGIENKEIEGYLLQKSEKIENFINSDYKILIKELNYEQFFEIKKNTQKITTNASLLQQSTDNPTNTNSNRINNTQKIANAALLQQSTLYPTNTNSNRIKSEIITKSDNFDFVFQEIDKQMQKNIEFSLIFSAKQHGFSASDFHKHCDGKRPLLVIVFNEFYRKFGGFVDSEFSSPIEIEYNFCEENRAFLFSVENKTIHPIKEGQNRDAILAKNSWGPAFGMGSNLFISDDCINNKYSHTKYFGATYSMPKNLVYNTKNSRKYLSGSEDGNFRVLNYEVFLCK